MEGASRQSVRKAASEFVVIVIGVLTALSVDSIWEERRDRSLEKEYIEQIRTDSHYNLARLDQAIELEERHRTAAERLLTALQPSVPPSVDSVRAGLESRDDTWWISDSRLLLGTITALVGTGDLTLIRELEVRSAVLAYQAHIESDLEEFRRFVQMGVDAGRDLIRRGAIRHDPEVASSGSLELRRMIAIHGDPEGIVALQLLEDSYSERLWYLRQMRQATDVVLEALEGT